jgi:hypothetical protein
MRRHQAGAKRSDIGICVLMSQMAHIRRAKPILLPGHARFAPEANLRSGGSESRPYCRFGETGTCAYCAASLVSSASLRKASGCGIAMTL